MISMHQDSSPAFGMTIYLIATQSLRGNDETSDGPSTFPLTAYSLQSHSLPRVIKADTLKHLIKYLFWSILCKLFPCRLP